MAIYPTGKSIPGIEGYTIEYITQTHPLYRQYIQRWNYLGDAYQGGFDYFMGRYLEPYYYESEADYLQRLKQTALDNHVRSVVGIYNSFLFRKEPSRRLGNLEQDPSVDFFLQDADFEGRSFNQFIRDVATFSMVYGNVWLAVDKPQSNAFTRADELNQGVRPYITMFTPENVLDWDYTREDSGLYRLTYVKVKEETQKDYNIIREYHTDVTRAYLIDDEDKTSFKMISETPNTTGVLPIFPVYAQRGNRRGVGVSLVADIADVQRQVYEEYNELTQIERLTNHPSLVKTPDVQASAGAGAIIEVPTETPEGLKPYLLQPDGASIESILSSINQKIEAIDRMACLGGIRSVESRRLSGIGLQTEFQMLNARLADIALNLEHCEEQIWSQYARLQGTTFDGEVHYPRSFSIQDKIVEVQTLKTAKDANIQNSMFNAKLDKMIMKTIIDDDDKFEEMMNEQATTDSLVHTPITTLDDMIIHLREMIEQGYSNEQILQLHPELGILFTPQNPQE